VAGPRRIRVTITLTPDDASSILLFRWLLGWLIQLHATSPCPVRFRVEMLPPDDPA
jgi:hypothetical protein